MWFINYNEITGCSENSVDPDQLAELDLGCFQKSVNTGSGGLLFIQYLVFYNKARLILKWILIELLPLTLLNKAKTIQNGDWLVIWYDNLKCQITLLGCV